MPNHDVIYENDDKACLKMNGDKRKIWNSAIIGNVTGVNGRLWRVAAVSGKRCYLDRAHDLEQAEGRDPSGKTARMIAKREWWNPISWIVPSPKWEKSDA